MKIKFHAHKIKAISSDCFNFQLKTKLPISSSIPKLKLQKKSKIIRLIRKNCQHVVLNKYLARIKSSHL